MANAKLIAAAPELYEALAALLLDQEHLRENGVTQHELNALAALRKARGES